MAERNRRLVLDHRPTGLVDASVVRLEDGPVPEPGPDEALVAVRYLSIDPTIRGWMNDAAGYLPPIEIGAVIRSTGLGEVIASRSDRYHPGDLVIGATGWQDFVLAGGGRATMQVVPAGVAPTMALGVLGVTGVTAYFGLLEVGGLRDGDTVVISGAAGAVGSITGQIAAIKGAGRVVGIAGTAAKCAWLVDELGFDAAIDYRRDDVGARLRAECPEGIDLYFDNVGGEILDACLARLALHGRVVLCGAISGYNAAARPPGPANYIHLLLRRGRMEGFIILDYLDRFAEGQAEMAQWVAEGKVKYAVHLVEGLEQAPEALNLLFTGGNTGKVIVQVD
jgi:NADPH-dependent curcumin reductase CurA